jgi:hypothetical protein
MCHALVDVNTNFTDSIDKLQMKSLEKFFVGQDFLEGMIS